MKWIISILLMTVLPQMLIAQQERKYIREGNGLFNGQDFEKAEVEYRKALDKEEQSFVAGFNLGDALYKQQKYEEALREFSALANKEKDKGRLGELYHNIGNTLLAMQKTDESIEAYKESLRNRPESQETKYNLEFARQRKEQEENQDQNQDQDQNKDQQKDDQDQQQNQDQNQEQDQNQDQEQQQDQNQDQRQNQDQQQEEQEQEGKISKEDARRLLEALQNDEKKVQEKVQKEKAEQQKAKRVKIDKNW